MKESFDEFDVEDGETRRKGGFARGAMIALPVSLGLWILILLLI